MSQLHVVGRKTTSAKSKCDDIMEKVLSRIVDETYALGEKLPSENLLAEEFGVSRITIREAFKKLNMLGVVSIRQGDGTFVEKTDKGMLFQPVFSALLFEHENIDQLYDARMWMEMGAVSMACANAQPADLAALDLIVAQMDEAMEREDGLTYSLLDDKLHFQLFSMANNFALYAMYTTIRDIVKLYRKKSLINKEQMKISHKRHHAILEAIRDGDSAAAVGLMRRHIEVCKGQLKERLASLQSETSYDNTIIEGKAGATV